MNMEEKVEKGLNEISEDINNVNNLSDQSELNTDVELISEVNTDVEIAPEIDFEKKLKSLEAQKINLQNWYKELVEKESALIVKEKEIFQKETNLDVKEQNFEESLKLKTTQESLATKRNIEEEEYKSNLKRIDSLAKKEDEFEASRSKRLNELERHINTSKSELNKELDDLRETLREELNDRRKNYEKEQKAQKEALAKYKKDLLEQTDTEIQDRTSEVNRQETFLAAERARIIKENEKIEALKKDIEEREEAILEEQQIIQREKNRLDKQETRIEEKANDLDELIQTKCGNEVKALNAKIKAKDSELENLRSQLKDSYSEVEKLKSFHDVYDSNPQILIEEKTQLMKENRELLNRICNAVERAEYDRLDAVNKTLKDEINRLKDENQALNHYHEHVATIEPKYNALIAEKDAWQSTCEKLKNQLEEKSRELIRLSTPEGRLSDRQARIETIKQGVLDDKKDLIGAVQTDGSCNKVDEIAWLNNVWKKCEEYGIKFNKRILYAFHTALKINEWSTITVLAGVSGTGKSELPRLYSEFGGLNFCSVAVQPNWDSQESMLGFFNSIDNKFEPEVLLRFLVQCTEDEKYKDYMSIVLLDEMNLAHVEHYFAEFLSKLETRRGLKGDEVPQVEVKLGAGVEPYGLKLSRTLLWTGTMNQDETTKSLSDKVLDRGVVINFPRPRSLESRNKMGKISDYITEDRKKLHRTTWSSWTTYILEFSEEQRKEVDLYRKIVEEINSALEIVGRALGHRVWQSIEYYIANYPLVRAAMNYEPHQTESGREVLLPTTLDLTGELKQAMRIAFEDQIVQKIMPKLRGIETRDKRGKKSLEKIESILVQNDFANLQEDFQIAREQGYGQFIWNSAKYLDEKESKDLQE